MLRDPYIVWSFPLMMFTLYLLATVSKPDMPHITLPEPPQPTAPAELAAYSIVFLQ